jgi:hypothetical protein
MGWRRRARFAALGSAGRCDLKSGGVTAFPGQCAKDRAPAGPREVLEVVGWLGVPVEGGLGEGRQWRPAGSVLACGGVVAL